MANDMSPPLTDNLHTIFVDSNMDTHFAMVVSLYDTISEVKAKIGAEHALCFQDIGEISIQAIKVRRRGFFYNIVDSMHVLNAFDGVQGSWFFFIDVAPMCNVNNQKVLPNKVTNEHLKHHDYADPVCSVDKHQEIAFCGLLPKNSGPDGQESYNPTIDHEHRATMLIDQEKDDRRKDDWKTLGIEANAMPSATCTHKTISTKQSKTSQQEKLLESQSQHYIAEKKRGKNRKDGLHEKHLEVCRRGSKFRRSEDIDESNKSAIAPQEISCDGKKEILATSSEGLLSKLPHENTIYLQSTPVKKHTKKRKSKSSKSHELAHLAIPSETAVISSPQVTTDPQNLVKQVNTFIFSGKRPAEPIIEESLPNDERDMSAIHDTASFLDCNNQKETRYFMEVNKEPIEEHILQVNPEDQNEKHVNSSQYTSVIVSLKEPAEAKASLQVVSEFPAKLCCNTEGLQSKLPHENIISLQDPPVEKHTKKRKRNLSKSHEEAHIVMSYGSVVARSPQLTVDSHNSGKETNASFFSGKHPPKPSIAEPLANDQRDMSASHDTVSFLEVPNQKENSHSMKINKEPIEEHILQVNPEDQSENHAKDQDTIVDVCFKEPVQARISSHVASESTRKLYGSIDKFQSQSSINLEPKEANSRESDATKCITNLNLGEAGYVDAKAGFFVSAEKFPFQEQATDAVSNLKGANKDCFLTKVDSKGSSKSQRNRKKAKAESSRVCESAKLNGNKDHFNSDNAQVSLNDTQNESNAANFIKQADQKANGDHNVDNMIKVSNAFVEQAAEISFPSQTSSEVQAKPRHGRKKSKSDPSKLGSQENCDVVLRKFDGKVTESNDERKSDPSKLANESNEKIELHCMDARMKVPLSDENSSNLVKVLQVNPLESSSCKLQVLSEKSSAEITVKGHVTQYETLAGPIKSNCDKKKFKKETLKAEVSSEMNEPTGLSRPDDSTIKFDDYFVPREGKHIPAVRAADPPTGNYESRKKNKTSRKTDINQPYQDSPTNLVQPSSYKQHMAIGQPLKSVTSLCAVDIGHDTGTKDPKTKIARNVKNTKQSSKQNSSFGRIESDSSFQKAHDKHKLDKKLHKHEHESHVQLLKSGVMWNKHGKKIMADGKGKTRSFAPDHDIDNMVSKDDVQYKDLNSSTICKLVDNSVGSNKFDVSQSEIMATEVASSDSTEDTPHQKRRYRVRKIPNPEKSLLVSSGRIFSDASVTSSESENDRHKKNAAIKTTLDDLSISGESQLEEVQTKASALKLRMDTNSCGAESDERGEIRKGADGRTKNHSRSDASAQKMPLSFILKSSISYRKSKLTASQSEFPDAESQPIDVVIETQPESAAP